MSPAAFYDALRLELFPWRRSLVFEYEHPLASAPLRVDVVVIVKTSPAPIDKNIARAFRLVNLFEYKPPDDYVSIDDYYKTLGYACLYSALEKEKQAKAKSRRRNKTPSTPVPPPPVDLARLTIDDLTVTIVESRYPKDLIDHLEAHGHGITRAAPGIYAVTGAVVPVQIVNSRELFEDDNLWLSSLDNRLGKDRIVQVTRALERLPVDVPAEVYWDTLFQANLREMEEALGMDRAQREIYQVLERTGYIAKAEAKGEEKASHKIARNFLTKGLSPELVADGTGLPLETVRELRAGAGL